MLTKYSIYTVDNNKRSLPLIISGYFSAIRIGHKMRKETGLEVIVRNTRTRTNTVLQRG